MKHPNKIFAILAFALACASAHSQQAIALNPSGGFSFLRVNAAGSVLLASAGVGLVNAQSGLAVAVGPSGTLAYLNVDSSGGLIISSTTLTAPIQVGNPAITDTGVASQFTSSQANYWQSILQNTNAGATASADYIVSNNLGTASTFYGDFGMNSSGFTGSGNFNAANEVYMYSASGDLSLGTITSNAIHFIVGGISNSDSLSISSAGVVSTTNEMIAGTAGSAAYGLNGAAGTATSSTELLKAVTAIANASPTAVLTVTIPNSAQNAAVHVVLAGSLGAGGAIGANEASGTVSYDFGVTRTAGVNATTIISTAYGSAMTNEAGAATITVTAAASAVAGAVGAVNTFTVNVTITHGTGSSTNHTCLVHATVINANASGVTIS